MSYRKLLEAIGSPETERGIASRVFMTAPLTRDQALAAARVATAVVFDVIADCLTDRQREHLESKEA